MSRQTRPCFVPCMMVAALALLGAEAEGAVVFSGSKSTTTAGSNIDIASVGSADWAVWTGVGAPAQQKASGTLIGDLVHVGTPGNSGFTVSNFTWASGGSPTDSSGGFTASVISNELSSDLDVGEGYSIDLTLSAASGTITFWGITRGASQQNLLTIEDSGSTQVYSDSYTGTGSVWHETTFTMDWSGATPGETVTLKYLTNGGNGSGRIGVSGIAVDAIPEPSSALLVGMFGCMLLLRRKRTS